MATIFNSLNGLKPSTCGRDANNMNSGYTRLLHSQDAHRVRHNNTQASGTAGAATAEGTARGVRGIGGGLW